MKFRTRVNNLLLEAVGGPVQVREDLVREIEQKHLKEVNKVLDSVLEIIGEEDHPELNWVEKDCRNQLRRELRARIEKERK